jgi:hypothetical protein
LCLLDEIQVEFVEGFVGSDNPSVQRAPEMAKVKKLKTALVLPCQAAESVFRGLFANRIALR